MICWISNKSVRREFRGRNSFSGRSPSFLAFLKRYRGNYMIILLKKFNLIHFILEIFFEFVFSAPFNIHWETIFYLLSLYLSESGKSFLDKFSDFVASICLLIKLFLKSLSLSLRSCKKFGIIIFVP